MEKEYKISWGKVILISILIIGVIFLIWLLSPKSKKDNLEGLNTFITNIDKMKEAGFEYFKGSNLPEKVGNSAKITLEEMIDSKLLIEFEDEYGKSCDLKESYVKVTKTLDNEYAMKVYLSCDSKKDYLLTTITENKVIMDSNSNSSTSNNGATLNNQNNSNSSSNNSKPTIVQNNYYNNYNSCNNCNSNCNNCTANLYYSVYFEANGGSYVPKQVVKEGETVLYRYTTRSGYNFLGWFTDKNLTQKYDFNTPVKGSFTLYAKWSKNVDKKYTVDFDSKGGSKVKSQTLEEGQKAKVPKDPTRECYIFLGWYLNGVKYDFNNPVYGDITLEAKWTADQKCNVKNYTVDFDSKGGSKVNSQTLEEGQKAKVPKDPIRECYIFLGWYLNGVKYDFNTPVYDDITLEAKWTADQKCNVKNYTVYFDANGGSAVNNQVVNEGGRAVIPANPSRNGYKFMGWYYNGSLFDFNSQIYHDLTLIAKWEKIEKTYSTYCKINKATYYSISYVGDDKKTTNYNWTIRFDDLYNVKNLKVTETKYLTTLADYNEAVRRHNGNKGISMVGQKGSGIAIPNGTTLQNYSLKASNFKMNLATPYTSGGYNYVVATVNIKNYYNVASYRVNNTGIYFVPFSFTVRYTDLNNCVSDLASNWANYSGYEVVNTYTK